VRTTTPRRTYDHRIRELACQSRDLGVAHYLGVPKSTMASWLRRGMPDVVTIDGLDTNAELRAQVVRLQRRVHTLTAIVRVLIATMRALRINLVQQRLPSAEQKTRILSAIRSAAQTLKLKAVLKIVGLSPARFHSWNSRTNCGLDDRSSCPRSVPTQLAAQEIARTRLHPHRPTVGIRATRPNEYWYIDVTVIRLLDDSRVYLHAIIDNFSRRILSWTLARQMDPTNTCSVLLQAGQALGDGDKPATFIADSGIENINAQVNAMLSPEGLRPIFAQVEVAYSNSMIEAFWRSLKHGWLFLNRLDSFAAVEKLVEFYVRQHNSVMPHAAFNGSTPDEVYFGTDKHLSSDLRSRATLARQQRLLTNRAATCSSCSTAEPAPNFAVISRGLHFHSQNSRRS